MFLLDKHSRIRVQIVLMISDFFSFFLAFVCSWWLIRNFGMKNPDFFSWMNSESGQARAWFSLIFSIISILWFSLNLQHYSRRKPFWSELKEVIVVITSLAVLDLVVTALEKWLLSRTYWVCLWGMTIVLIPSFRFFSKKILNNLGFWQWPSVIIGCGDNAKDAWVALNSEKLMGFDFIGFIQTKDNMKTPIENVPLINKSIHSLLQEVPNLKVFIAVDHDEHDILDYYLRILVKLRVNNFEVVPSIRGIPLYGSDISHFFSYEVLLIQIKSNLSSLVSRAIKRIFDVIVSTCLILFLAPIYIFIALKISRDGGPVIYSHERIGFQNREFNCLKFRTMVINSHEVLQEMLAKDSDAREEWYKDFKIKNDPRITTIGNFLRKTSLDELPQLWNVLKGDMSLVGPRPVVAEELSKYGDDVDYYLMIKPGMTGLWQVSGRNDTDYETRVYLDVWYVKNWSLWYDIAILFKTINVVLKSEGAY